MFCSHCGTKLEPGQGFCASCGKPVVMVAMPAVESRLARHLRLLGALWIALSAIRLLGAGAALIVVNVLFRNIRIPSPAVDFLPAMISWIGGFLLVLAVTGFVAGWALLERVVWARLLALIVAFVSLLDIPFGMILGIYTLWVLLPSEAEEEYRRMARAT